MMNKALVLIFSLLLFTACEEQAFRESKVMAGGKLVTADTLNKGKQIYAEYCMPCHGADGGGKGVASKGMTTPPRNFKLGIIKFGDVVSGDLTHDEAVYKSLKEGLHGTAMLPWDLQPGQMEAVWQYIKTFAPETWEGKDKKLGEKIVPNNDPFGLARKSSAIEKGKEVYHVTGDCQSCHRAYVSVDEYKRLVKKVNDDEADDPDETFFQTKPQESEHDYITIPPDFTWDLVRSAQTVEELYVRIAAGVGGTAMPAWKETITDEEIWAVSYYVKSLMDLRDKPNRKDFISKLK